MVLGDEVSSSHETSTELPVAPASPGYFTGTVAADVRRRMVPSAKRVRLLTSAATGKGRFVRGENSGFRDVAIKASTIYRRRIPRHGFQHAAGFPNTAASSIADAERASA